jgi:hypothetical protein
MFYDGDLEGRALSRPKFRDDTAVVPPKLRHSTFLISIVSSR